MLPSLLLLIAILPLTLAKTSCPEKVNQCQARNLKRPVCGSDNHTYPTRCHLLRSRCQDNPGLHVIRKGPCSEWHPCWDNMGGAHDAKLGYEVKCLPDGTYAPMQCHSTGYCWCVTESGLPIANTSVRHRKPTCHIVKDKKVKKGRGNRGRKACGKVERVKFINKIVSVFNVELCRYEEKDENCVVDDEERQKKTVPWKFYTLDTNSDNVLISDEYNGFVNLVKKAVKPQRCAQSFVNICDENKDKNITLTEWSNCLVKRPVVKKNKPKRRPFDELDFGRGVALLNSQLTPIEEPQTDKKEEPEGSDCLTDRKNVLDERPEASIKVFLPECTADGRYQQVQCYKSTGYCWCVNEDTGKPIPGTSRKDTSPNCDELALPLRPMKGCPDYKKKIFLKELKNFFRVRVTSTDDDKDDKFAASIFQILDTNKNKVLEKNEMRPFRTLLASFSHPVKRCGKKFPKYCDVNHDRKISLTEWVNCMDSERQGVGLTISNRGQRKGPNPLETILKPDDE